MFGKIAIKALALVGAGIVSVFVDRGIQAMFDKKEEEDKLIKEANDAAEDEARDKNKDEDKKEDNQDADNQGDDTSE